MDQRIHGGFRVGLPGTPAGLDCRMQADFSERCRAGVGNVWFGVYDEEDGGRFDVPPNATEHQITTFWKGIDPNNFRAFEPQLEARVQEAIAREDAEFVPRWGMTAALTSGLTPATPVSELGAKLGVRRWFSINWGGFVALDYGLRLTPQSHRIGARVGVELTRFTPGRFWDVVGAPPASVFGYVGPRLQLDGPVPGMRTGVGVLMTDWKMAPLILEFCADTWFTGETSRVDFFLAFGFGL